MAIWRNDMLTKWPNTDKDSCHLYKNDNFECDNASLRRDEKEERRLTLKMKNLGFVFFAILATSVSAEQRKNYDG